ncbi:AMP-binding protein [Thalassotalea ponticola]|uniref:AMP-binding protein n=1 Tax=Thalassotalea ponticola TaxID=1523392 RepID=UPI0025B4833D|nr:AMP-binding protein [Thalassotalea ponticola]MDN3653442.1 AMP-binding protein [Thalassotalea ponticola]
MQHSSLQHQSSKQAEWRHPARTIGELATNIPPQFAAITALKDADREVSYAELSGQIQPICKALMASGVIKGDRVAIWAPNSIDWVLIALAIHACGAILVPINTRMKGPEVAHILNESQCKVLFSVGKFLKHDYPMQLHGQQLSSQPLTVLLAEQVSSAKAAVTWSSWLSRQVAISESALKQRLASVDETDGADILFTSGTTGKPKGVLCSHGATLKAYRQYINALGYQPGERFLIVNPFFHAFGYKAGWVSALLAGCTILPEAVFDAEKILQRIETEQVNILPGPPTLYSSLLAVENIGNANLSSLRVAVTGSSSVSPTLVESMWKTLQFDQVVTAYGLTECGGLATMCRADDSATTIANTSGKAIADTQLAILNDNGDEVAQGEVGEICLRGYHIMQGYWQNDVATRAAIDQANWLHTGDLGYLDQQGNLCITGRLKDMYICGGFNCYPAEIEAIMQTHPHIHDVAVIGVPDERMGEVGCAFVIAKGDYRFDPDELIHWCRDNMANYKTPRFIRQVDAFPLNASNKVLKQELFARF